jgi:L-seryl-tRNA(Ser) seleniumtransferase
MANSPDSPACEGRWQLSLARAEVKIAAMTEQQQRLRQIPSVDRVQRDFLADSTLGLPRALVTEIVRREIESVRASVLGGDGADVPGDVAGSIGERLRALSAARIQPVINATGVLIHTNLGRSPVTQSALERAAAVASGYSNLELDLLTGKRGHRGALAEEALACLCGAEAATVVNNCASALVLVLRALAAGERREVVISRGELVEIGGGFRVPEIMETSGARLREVGTTNRTQLDDYRRAISPQTAMLLKVHRSNFHMTGFVESPGMEELAALAREHGLPVVEDLGSGAMMDTRALGAGESEPTAAQCIAAGADLVCVSGDKLFGGPQAGIIAGRRELVRKLKRDPFFRVLRCDKIVLTLLQETALACLEARSEEKPVLPDVALIQLAAASCDELRSRGEKVIAALAAAGLPSGVTVEIAASEARFGGGTMPQCTMPSILLRVRGAPGGAEALAAGLRRGTPPVIGHVEEGALSLDLRAVFPQQDEMLARALKAVFAKS